jgi:hypothetical protein
VIHHTNQTDMILTFLPSHLSDALTASHLIYVRARSIVSRSCLVVFSCPLCRFSLHQVHFLPVLYNEIQIADNNKVKRVLADGMYDSNNNFRYLSKKHIKPGIKTRHNSKVN